MDGTLSLLSVKVSGVSHGAEFNSNYRTTVCVSPEDSIRSFARTFSEHRCIPRVFLALEEKSPPIFVTLHCFL